MIKTPLRPYQSEAVEKAMGHDGFALYLEQRTGKTLTALAVVDQRKPQLLVIVCPKKAIRVWEAEIKKHMTIDWPMKHLLINYESVINRSLRKKIRLLCLKYRSMVILDESHRIKRRGSRASRSCRVLGRACDWRLALTGTPIAQGLHDAWAQYDFLDPLIFGEWSHFEERYCIKGGFKGRQITDYRNREHFEHLFHQYSYRKTLREARKEGGKKAVIIRRIVRKVELEPPARQAYNELERDLITLVRQKTIETPLVITLVMKLQQIAGGFIKDEDGEVIQVGSEKLDKFETVVQEFQGKAVVCVRFIHEATALEELLTRLGKTHITIKGGVEWDGTFHHDVTILQIQSGVAIDLSAAEIIIFYSWDYSYINYEQARFRVLSYDQTRVTYVYLMAEDSIDLQIYEAITRKKNLATLICDHYRHRRPR